MNVLTQPWHRFYRYRTLAEILIARDLKARYRGTLLGFCWSFVTPLLMMTIYVLVFSVYMRVDVPNYAAFLLAGLLPWSCFVACLNDGMHAIIANGNLIKKVHLPSEVFPLVAVASNMLHFLFSLPVLLLLLAVYHITPTPAWLVLPVLLMLQLLFSYGAALVLSSLAVQFRDLTHIVPNIIMMWFYMTPIIYDIGMVPSRLQPWMRLNPMTGLIQAYREMFLNGQLPSALWLVKFSTASILGMVFGLWVFRRRQDLYPELV